MEKLVKLLNEYHFSGTEYVGYYLDEEDNRIYFRTKVVDKGLIDEQRISDERIISKKFGFIKWLVENDKIDNKKIADETYVKVNGEWYELILGCHYDLYQQTLMLLSISDTPIDDLISYLK